MARKIGAVLLLLTLLGLQRLALADANELRIAQQYGISYLPFIVLESNKLVEKHAAANGVGSVKVTYAKFAGGSVMNDALLSGSLDIASAGVAPAITLWAKTRGTGSEVRLISALNSMPMYLNTRSPNVKTIKDFTDKDKIALPAVKVSIQAVTLQMAAEKAFGPGQYYKLDPLTVTLSHRDAETALLSGAGEITAHFGTPPSQYQELEKPGIHTVLNSYDVLGGKSTLNVVYATSKFRDANPRLYKAFIDALDEANAIIAKDKKGAAELYLKSSKDKDTVSDILVMLNDPQIEFTKTPKQVTKYSDFLYKTGAIKQKPSSWKDLFFPEVHQLPGS